MQVWVISLAIQFALRQLSKYGDSLDWDKVKADAAKRIKPLIWGPLQTAAADLVGDALDACKLALSHADAAKPVLEALAAHDVAVASHALAGIVGEVEHSGAELAAAGAWSLHEAAAA